VNIVEKKLSISLLTDRFVDGTYFSNSICCSFKLC